MKKIIISLTALFFIFFPTIFVSAEDYCTWRKPIGSGYVVDLCNYDYDKNKEPYEQDSSKTSCKGQTPLAGETVCCCQIKDIEGQCKINKTCPGNNKCVDGFCLSDAEIANAAKMTGTEPKIKLPDYVFQIPIGSLSKLTTVDCSDGSCEIPFIAQYISAVYDYGLYIAGVLGVLMLMAAGLLWIVSGGDSGKITKAKQMIFGSVTGLLLLVGLNLFLVFINPDLIKNKSIVLESIERKEIEALSEARSGSTASSFVNSGCATDEQLKNGVDFFSTGYFKPDYNISDPNFFCIVHMQCSCPNNNALDKSTACAIYKKAYPNGYYPCKSFDSSTPYCNMTSSGSAPQIGDIAGPGHCSNLSKGDYVCFKGKTYKITDTGGAIQGKRIDIWSGNSISAAYANTGVGKLTKGRCP